MQVGSVIDGIINILDCTAREFETLHSSGVVHGLISGEDFCEGETPFHVAACCRLMAVITAGRQSSTGFTVETSGKAGKAAMSIACSSKL